MLHISNFYHLIFIVLCWFVIAAYTRKAQGSKLAITMRLLHVVPALFAVDLIAGFTLIDQVYGPHQSAGWISKSAMLFPVLFIAALWRQLRLQHKPLRK